MPGYTLDQDDYRRRLARIEGQVRGLGRMIEEDAYCIDVLTQIASVTKALQGVALGLLDQHISHCVVDAAAHGEADLAHRLEDLADLVAKDQRRQVEHGGGAHAGADIRGAGGEVTEMGVEREIER